MAEMKFIQIVAAAQALLAAWAVLTPLTAGTQPLLACASPLSPVPLSPVPRTLHL